VTIQKLRCLLSKATAVPGDRKSVSPAALSSGSVPPDVAYWKILEAGGHLEDEMEITGDRKR